jgi:hypothetical protein
MTCCLISHRKESRSRGHEALISSPLGFTNFDLRSLTPHRVNLSREDFRAEWDRKSSIVNFCVNHCPPTPLLVLMRNPSTFSSPKMNQPKIKILLYLRASGSSTAKPPGKVKQGKTAQKKSANFFSPFHQKSLANQVKTTQKTLQNHSKKSPFLTRFPHARRPAPSALNPQLTQLSTDNGLLTPDSISYPNKMPIRLQLL